MADSPRHIAFDHLRSIAMLLGVVFHASLAYSPLAHDFWPAADRQQAAIVDGFAWPLHLFRMPLFFLLAGWFTADLMARRGVGGMLHQRVRRILVPFLLAWPIVWFLLSSSTEWAARHVQHPSPVLVVVRDWLQMADPPRVPPSTAHLWFLAYLMLFAVLTWAAAQFDLGAIRRWFAARPGVRLLVILPALPVLALLGVPAPHPAPEGLLPQFWAITLFGTYFVTGAWLRQEPDLLVRFQPAGGWLLAGAVMLSAIYLAWLPGVDLASDPVRHVVLAVTGGYAGFWATLACLLLAQRFLVRHNPVSAWFAGASYGIYVWHLPVLFGVQYLLMDRDWPWALKAVAAILATLLVCGLGVAGWRGLRRILSAGSGPQAVTGTSAR